MVNVNPETGIPYGVIRADSLGMEIVDVLLWGPQAMVYSDGGDEDSDGPYPDEPDVQGILEGVTYMTCWLGGALNFFILHSPVITKGGLCSPCVPGACNLDSPGEYEGYGVPESWGRDFYLEPEIIN